MITIGQRLCDKFDDVPLEEVGSRVPHVFIAGDACHTHSPKAGQGMNVSMRDTFNLGWKLVSVLQGKAAPAILDTYTTERQTVAKELIDFDRTFARMFSAPPKGSPEDQGDGVDPKKFQEYFIRLPGDRAPRPAHRPGPAVGCPRRAGGVLRPLHAGGGLTYTLPTTAR